MINLPRIVREVRPDCIYAPTHIAYKVKGIKTILAMRNMAIPEFLKIDVPVRMRFSLFLKYFPTIHALRNADKVIAVSQYVRNFLLDKVGKDEKDIFVAYHMINNLHKENTSQIEQYDNINNKDRLIFIPGSYYRYKKFHVLLKYLDTIQFPRKTKVVFAGDEGDQKYLACLRQYKTNNYKPVFKTCANIQQMKFLYKTAKLVILSSQVEACPNIALEALANNSKVLSCNIPPFREILGEFATFFDIANKDDFVSKFHSAISAKANTTVQQKQMETISEGNTILDLLNFFDSE